MTTQIMGVLNVTPDSFSDGGLFSDTDAAVAAGVEMVRCGATIVDVGGESTRPGAERVPVELERQRVLPVIERLAASGITVSIDTTRAVIAEEAVARGASIVNDVSGGLADGQMLHSIASLKVPWVLMHWRAPSSVMAQHTQYADVTCDVRDELEARIEAAVAAGVDTHNIILDPGVGFAKTAEQSWELLRNLDALLVLGFPVLVGASRKSFLTYVIGEREAAHRDSASVAIAVHAASHGVWGVRVHDVAATRDALQVDAHLKGV